MIQNPTISDPDMLVPEINLRDCGGYQATNGYLFKPGIFYRSGNLENLNIESRTILSGLHLQTIVDFRALEEQQRSPSAFFANHNVSLPCAIDQITKDRLRPLLMRRSATAEIIKTIESVYSDMVDMMVEPIGQLIRILIDPDNLPVLIHCQGGKDRTGFSAALIQKTLGVDHEIVIREYLKSNIAQYPKIQKVKRRIALFTLGLVPLSNLNTAFEVKPQFLETAFDKIENKYGGLEGYFAACGISPTHIQQLQHSLLTQNPDH